MRGTETSFGSEWNAALGNKANLVDLNSKITYGRMGLGNTGVDIPGGDYNNVVESGFYIAGQNTLNTFSKSLGQTSSQGETMISSMWNTSTCAQIAVTTDNRMGYRKKTMDTWRPWKLLATTEPPQEYDLPLGPNVSSQGVKYFKDGCGKVGVNGVFSFNAAPSAAQLIGTLPIGFRPRTSKSIILQSSKNDSMYGYIHSNGQIVLADTAPAQGFTVGRQIAIVASLFTAI